jgi:hypothetical protein
MPRNIRNDHYHSHLRNVLNNIQHRRTRTSRLYFENLSERKWTKAIARENYYMYIEQYSIDNLLSS